MMTQKRNLKTGLLTVLGLLLLSACGDNACKLTEGAYADSKTDPKMLFLVTSKNEIALADVSGNGTVLKQSGCTLSSPDLAEKVSISGANKSSLTLQNPSGETIKLSRMASLNGLTLDQIGQGIVTVLEQLIDEAMQNPNAGAFNDSIGI